MSSSEQSDTEDQENVQMTVSKAKAEPKKKRVLSEAQLENLRRMREIKMKKAQERKAELEKARQEKQKRRDQRVADKLRKEAEKLVDHEMEKEEILEDSSSSEEEEEKPKVIVKRKPKAKKKPKKRIVYVSESDSSSSDSEEETEEVVYVKKPRSRKPSRKKSVKQHTQKPSPNKIGRSPPPQQEYINPFSFAFN